MLSKFENEGLGAFCQCCATVSTMSLQLMLSKFENDGKLNPSFKTGPFKLPVAKIWGYPKEPQSPRFVLVSSAGVTRPSRSSSTQPAQCCCYQTCAFHKALCSPDTSCHSCCQMLVDCHRHPSCRIQPDHHDHHHHDHYSNPCCVPIQHSRCAYARHDVASSCAYACHDNMSTSMLAIMFVLVNVLD